MAYEASSSSSPPAIALENRGLSELRKRLYATYIVRLGSSRVSSVAKAELSRDVGGASADEKAMEIVESYGYQALDEMIVEGFGRNYHQTVYVYKTEGNPTRFRGARTGTTEGVRIRHVGPDASELMMLFPWTMEFLAPNGPTFSRTIQVPVLVRVGDGRLRIHVMTLKAGSSTWSWIVESPVRRPLTHVNPDRVHDEVLQFVSDHYLVRHGSYVNYSRRAKTFMKEGEVDAFSGAFEERDDAGPKGTTRHDSIPSTRNRRPLRESMPRQFDRLLDAIRIHRVELKLNKDHRQLREGTTMVLHPANGKFIFRANLNGGDLHGFLDTLA